MVSIAQRHSPLPIRILAFLLGLLAFLLLLPSAAGAQPFGAWPVFLATTGKYIDIPTSPDLNPVLAITIEAWVSHNAVSPPAETCRSILGKNFQASYWVGICGNTLRTYLKGGILSQKNGGTVPNGEWTHIAVTYDGANRIHYINGEQVAIFPEAGALPGSGASLRIGSDVQWDFQPNGAINEVRLWSVARTVDQIRGSINVPITTAQPGLVAVWPTAGPNDIIGGHNGSIVGGVGFLTFPVALSCGSSTATTACLNTRFAVNIRFRDPNTGVTSDAHVVDCPNPDSALFWFFASNAWEVMVKTINACSFVNRYWAFSAATTNVFYRLNVMDVKGGAAKIYFNYPGPPAPAVTDTNAFATCP